MIYFIYFYSLEMWTGISIPVHIFESRAEVVYRELRREKRLAGTSNLEYRCTRLRVKKPVGRVRAVAHGHGRKKMEKKRAPKGLLLHSPP